MAQLQDFARMVVFLDGRQITLAESWSLKNTSGQQPILILNEGLAGFTPGAGQTDFSGTLYIPIGGFEEDVDTYCSEGSYHTFQIGIGPKAKVIRGKFMDTEISQSTGDNMKMSFNFVGEKSLFQ